jgi:MoxR-like ATPase
LTSNWKRDEESTEAVMDRILFRSEVKPLANVTDRIRMYKNYLTCRSNGIIPLERTLPLKVIKTLSENLHDIDVDNETLKYYDSVMREFVKQTGIYISDRTSNKILNLLRMRALLECRTEVVPEDILSAQYALYGRETKENSIKAEEIFKVVFEKQVIEGRVEASELKKLKPFNDPVKRMRETTFDADREKNILRLVEAENKEIEGLEKLFESLQTEKCKKLVEGMIEELKTDIQKAKDELLGGSDISKEEADACDAK